jgi:hypothetical protein
MANNVLTFPRKFFAESPSAPARTSPSAEEAAFNRPRFGLNLGNGPHAPIAPSLAFTSQITLAVSRVDREIAQLAARTGLHRPSPDAA